MSVPLSDNRIAINSVIAYN